MNGMGKEWGTFENLTKWKKQNKYAVSLGSCSFKMHLLFLKILASTLERGFFYHGEFL